MIKILDLHTATSFEDLREKLATLKTSAEVKDSQRLYYQSFPQVWLNPGVTKIPDGFFPTSDHPVFPELFPVINPRPISVFSPAGSWDPSRPTLYSVRLMPQDAISVIAEADGYREGLAASERGPQAQFAVA